ncbi:MAG: CpsB/CapC family capsule biosynthesis tyrosine phosphatase [Gaiellaceae bacterium]
MCCSRRRTCTSRWTRFPGRRRASSATRKHSRRCSQLPSGWGSISAGGGRCTRPRPCTALSTGLRLAGTSAVLVEFPGWWLDVDDAVGLTWAACERIDAEGLVPVLAHPKRCPAVAADPASAVRFAARGWPLCLNGPSVLGDHGQTAACIAWWLLGEGTVSLVASDAHGAGRLPVLDVAREAIAQRLDADVADPLFDGRALQLGYD